MDDTKRTEWAVFRWGVIAPLESRQLDDDQRQKVLQDILQAVYRTPDGELKQIPQRTVRTWRARHRLYGFEGLLDKVYLTAETCSVIPAAVIDEAVELRNEIPTRSVKRILSILRMKNIDVSSISRSTLNFHLNRRGATKEKHRSEKGTFQPFTKKHANLLWQGDSSGGIYLPDPYRPGEMKQTRFISFIDDCTRVVTHAAFYWNEQLPSLFDCFRKALLKHGRCAVLYTDNGPCYRANELATTCAKLGIELRHAETYTPEGKGKIEKHIGTTKAGFYEEASRSGLKTLEELNAFFFAWLNAEYHNTKHSSLGMTPFERWQQEEALGTIQMVTAEQIRNALMVSADRIVNKRTALIQLHNKTFQVGPELAGKKVQVRWEADRHNPEIEVWLHGKLVGIAPEMIPGSDIDYSKRPDRNRQPDKHSVLQSSKEYRHAMVNAHKNTLEPDVPGDFLSEPEFTQLVAQCLDRQLALDEQLYLSNTFAQIAPLRETLTQSTLLKAIDAKGSQMHLRYYCDLLAQDKLSSRR